MSYLFTACHTNIGMAEYMVQKTSITTLPNAKTHPYFVALYVFDDHSSILASRPAFFAGRWKSEGPGISCMRMHSIPPFRGDHYTFGHVRYTNRYIIVILRAESAASSRLFCLSALDSTHLTPRSVLCKLFMKKVICLCRYQLVRREESLLSKYHVLTYLLFLTISLA